ncbi:MAG: DUF4838 domain-containing protein [Victivallales bacterium]|nr:DUF4838 domain-containing protein [Victivallales bacterium]
MFRDVAKFFLAVLLVALAFPLSAARLLAPTGQPYRAIVKADDDARAADLAARELQTWLEREFGMPLPIVAETPEAPAIRVGAAAGLATDLSDEPADAFLVRTAENGDLLIAGVDNHGEPEFGMMNPWRDIELMNAEAGVSLLEAAGTANGVYAFLENECGIRFYGIGPDGTDVPELTQDLQLGDLDYRQAPRFAYRYPWISFLARDPETAYWQRRVGFGGAAPVQIIHGFWLMNQYRDSHPEFFALTEDGGRAFANEHAVSGQGNLCLHNEAMMDAFLDLIAEYFAKHPGQEVFPMGANDGLFQICACPECQADLAHPHREGTGDFSWHIWGFVNRMAKRLAERCPGKFLGCIAYEKYLEPPEGMVFEPNVIVMLCHARSALANPQAAQEFHDRIGHWLQYTSQLYFWDWYLTHWPPSHNLPILYARTIEREIRHLAADPRMRGEFIEDENRPQMYEFGFDRPGQPCIIQPNLYLTAKLLWNPARKVADLLEEFYVRYYGPAAQPMKTFWELAQDAYETAMRENAKPAPEEIFPPNVIATLEGCLETALAATPVDGVHHRRIAALQAECASGFTRIKNLAANADATYAAPVVTTPDEVVNAPAKELATIDGLPASPQTILQIAYDRSNLYFLITCHEPAMEQLVTNAEHFDADEESPWNDDGIELFIGPDFEDKATVYHLIITAGNVLWDARQFSPLRGDKSWDSNAHTGVIREADRWALKITLPVDALGVTDPNFAPDLLLQVYRSRKAGGFLESSAWIPTGEGVYFQPERFGRLKFAH